MKALRNKRFKIFIVLFFILNILVTYVSTTSTLNQYIVTFGRTFMTELSSIVGNFAILSIILLVGMLFIKKERGICGYMLTVTFLLNLFVFIIGYFTKNYKTMLSLNNLTLFRNPDAGFAGRVIIDAFVEMILYFRIICFIPFFVLLIYYICTQKSFRHKYYHFSLVRKFICMISALILSLSSVMFFKYKLSQNWEYRTEVPQYGCQVCGIYNYFFAEIFYGLDYSKDYVKNDIEVIKGTLETYNKNKATYKNIIDGIEYYKPTNGPLEGMNLFVIQVESWQTITLELNYEKDGNEYPLMPYMQQLINEKTSDGKQAAFYFSNAHTVVGLGNTSDAEFTFNTGIYPTGDETIAWQAYDYDFSLNNLSDAFGADYLCYSYNPTVEEFYAHKFVHENLYAFDKFRGIESYRVDYPQNEENAYRYLRNNWVADEYMLKYAIDHAKDAVNSGKNYYSFVETISPHLPFDDLSENYPSDVEYEILDFGDELSDQFTNYLNQFHHNDKIIYDCVKLLIDEIPNSVVVLYGDHGNTLQKEYYEYLLGRELTDLQYRKELLNIPIVFYDPSGKLADYCDNLKLDLSHVLNRTCSQIDLYSTIHIMFNLDSKANYYGVNLFSNEPSFSIDPKNLDIITDEFMYSLKNNDCEDFDGNMHQLSDSEQALLDEISNFKLFSDYYLSYIIDNAEKRKEHDSSFIDNLFMHS